MIARIWRTPTSTPGTSTTPALPSTLRPRGTRRLDASARRRRPDRVPHLSLWESVDAIRALAGDDIEAAVLYPEDARSLVGESTVTHYQVID